MGVVSMDKRFERIAAFVADRMDAREVFLHEPRPLSGGAIQENWALDVEIEGAGPRGTLSLVLRCDAVSSVPFSHSRKTEFAILRHAFDGGANVPEPLWYCDDASVFGQNFMLMNRIPGTASPHTLMKSLGKPEDGDALVFKIGVELAKIHSLTLFQTSNGAPAVVNRLSQFRAFMNAHPVAHPAIEWSMRWIAQNAFEQGETVFCHNDFRTGNIMIHQGEVSGVLDWEFAAEGDPFEDLGWFCAECWRFGQTDREAGGLGTREAFYEGYESAAPRQVDPLRVQFWEVVAMTRWAIIALAQTRRFTSGEERSLELGLTGLLVPELEQRIMELTGPQTW